MPAVIKVFLFLLSFIYGLAVRILILFYRVSPVRLNCKVISVGNITLGGTGKTTLVEYIARYLKQQGHAVAILSRGYKRKVTSYQLCRSMPRYRHAEIFGIGIPKRYFEESLHSGPVTSYGMMGDEPCMLSQNLGDVPILVDANRIRAANSAIHNYKVDTVILDDGFQQWRLKKDLELVTIDATQPFGNRQMLPRGILREPLSSLKRADIFVLTKTNFNADVAGIKDTLKKLNAKAQIVESAHKPVGFYNINKPEELLNIDGLRGKTVTLFSGIGDPNSFEALIARLGINIGKSFRFSDHHHYSPADLAQIIKESQDKNIDTLITTKKDAVRLEGLRVMDYGLRFLALEIKLEIKDEERFYDRLLKLYSL